MNKKTKSLIVCLAINAIALCAFARAEDSTFAGKWDSTINNLMEHPKTVALRIEVIDKETQEPIPNAKISFEGEYWIAPRTSMHPEGEREAQEMEYNGYSLKVVSNFESTHTATVSGRLLYGKIRVDEIQLSFANRKLMSVSFGSANSSDAEALYAQIEKTFGVGLTTISHATEEQKKSIENPRLCKNSERYFTPTAIESRLSYTWSQRERRFVQHCSINIYDWIKSDKVWDRDHSFEANRFQKLLKERATKKEISCNYCNGSGKCLSCNGKGQIYRDVYVKCGYPACGGRGRYRVRGGGVVTCRRCRGAGKFKKDKGENVTCSKCDGSGKCSTCKGKGKVPVR